MHTTVLIQAIVQTLAFFAVVIFVPAIFFKWIVKSLSRGSAILCSIFSLFLPVLILSNNYLEIQQVVEMGAAWGLPYVVEFSSAAWAFTLGSAAAPLVVVIQLIQGRGKKIGINILGFMCLSAALSLLGLFGVPSVFYGGSVDMNLANTFFVFELLITLFFSGVYFVFSDKSREVYWS